LPEPGFQNSQHRGELRKDQGLVPFFEHFIEMRQERLKFGARLIAQAGIDQSGMDGSLPESKQRLEDVNLVPSDSFTLDFLQQFSAVVVAQ